MKSAVSEGGSRGIGTTDLRSGEAASLFFQDGSHIWLSLS
jgi:hypothetical protein